MTRNVEEVIGKFFDKVEEDRDFFAYYGVEEAEALAIAQERAQSYLREAIVYMRRQQELDFTLGLTTDEKGTIVFVDGITDVEADLLSEIMLMHYLERGYAKLKPKINVLSSTDLKVLHSPANERTSYVSMIDNVREHVYAMLSHYAAIDRNTGRRKMMSSYGTFEAEGY